MAAIFLLGLLQLMITIFFWRTIDSDVYSLKKQIKNLKKRLNK